MEYLLILSFCFQTSRSQPTIRRRDQLLEEELQDESHVPGFSSKEGPEILIVCMFVKLN
jgi:hypothetical protein